MRTEKLLGLTLLSFFMASTCLTSKAGYCPEIGRFLNRDPSGNESAGNLYAMADNNVICNWDYLGLVTYEQINRIALQVGAKPIDLDFSNATKTIVEIQKRLNVNADGDFGPGSVKAYEEWALAHGQKAVVLRDSKTPKEVLDWVVAHWPNEHKCAPYCPVYYGEFLALIYYESRDHSTSQNGNRYTYFNAVGGPFASKIEGQVGSTAVGLMQLNRKTASRDIAYDGEKSVEFGLKLMFDDAAEFDCNFEPEQNKTSLRRGLNRWASWGVEKESIIQKGKLINDLIHDKYKGDPSKVQNSELNAIFGI